MPHNKALQLTVNPLRGLSAAELRRYTANWTFVHLDADATGPARGNVALVTSARVGGVQGRAEE